MASVIESALEKFVTIGKLLKPSFIRDKSAAIVALVSRRFALLVKTMVVALVVF